MKSYNNLWDKFISKENIRLAIQKSSRGKKDRKIVRDICNNIDDYIPKIIEYANNFQNFKHTPIEIYDGITRKKRTIIVPRYQEQIIHHMAVLTLEPIFMHGMYFHSYGSIPNRGAHKGKKYVEKWINHDVKNVKYVLKMDIKKYFDSVDTQVLKNKLSKIIRDEKFLNLLFTIIDVIPQGLPLGFYTSQWFANWLLQDLDHYIKEKLCVKHYIRYMDDMVIFGSNKRGLHKVRIAISDYLEKELHLQMKSNWQVYRFHYVKGGKNYGRDLDFMGFRFFRNKTVLRKSIMYKASRKARKIGKKDKPTIYDCRQILSYLGWLNATDTYDMYLKHIKPFVNFKKCKKRISNYEKRITRKNR